MLGRLFLWLLRIVLWLFRHEAVRLNFTVHANVWTPGRGFHEAEPDEIFHGDVMAKIGDTFTGRIAPTNAAGAPAPVFDAVYMEDGDSYDFTVAPDGLSVTFVARAAGTGNLARVSALTKGGATLSEIQALPDVESPVDEEAVALNFTVA